MAQSKIGAGEVLLYVIGGASVAYGSWKGYIDGFYPSEAPVVFGAAIVGAVLLFVASRLSAARARSAAQAADRERGVE
jgi:hypothetical protein